MGRSEKQASQQGWFCSRKIYSRAGETFLATSPHGFLPSQIYSTTFIISSSCLQQPCSQNGAKWVTLSALLHSPHDRKGSQFHRDVGTWSSHPGSRMTPYFLWLCTNAGTVSVPVLTSAWISGLCFNEKTRARTVLRYGALMRREERWKASRSIFSASGWSIWKQQSIKLDLYI